MDLNNVNDRLNRIYSAIDIMEKSSTQEDIIYLNSEIKEQNYRNRTEIKIKQNVDSEVYVNSVIDHLAHIKDPLKAKIESIKLNKKIIEDEINNSYALKILIDLSNSAKHGYPLTKPERSGLSPKIDNIEKVFAVKKSNFDADGGIDFLKFNDERKPIISDKINTTVFALIKDRNNNQLMTLNQLIKQSLNEWERIINKYNLKL